MTRNINWVDGGGDTDPKRPTSLGIQTVQQAKLLFALSCGAILGPVHGQCGLMTGTPNVAVDGTAKTFTRDAGSFLTDGFAVGQSFQSWGFSNAANNGFFTITSVSATVLTCSGATLVTEGSGSNRHIGPSGLRDIYLNDVPIQNSDGTFNFSGINVSMTKGTLTQTPINGFSDTESVTVSGAQILNSTPQPVYIPNVAATAVRLNISLPALYQQSSYDGSMSGDTVNLKVEVSNNGASYVDASAKIGADVLKITGGPTTGAVVRSIRLNLTQFGSGPWSVRVSRVTADNNTTYRENRTYLQSYSAITEQQLRYPGTALLAITVDAKRFSSMPKVSVRSYGRKVLVPANYTPATRNPDTGVWTPAVYATTGTGTSGGSWDGTFKEAWTSNPAWIFMDMATSKVYGAGTYLSQSGVDKWGLYTLAMYCDGMVSDGFGGTEPRFAFNGYIQSQEEAFHMLAHIISCARAQLYYGKGKVMPVQDVDDTPVHLFTPSNVVGGKFSYSGTARKARHTVAQVTWNDPAQLWKAVPEQVQADSSYISRYGVQVTSYTAVGCTSKGQARRSGRYTLLSELNETEAVTFSTGIEGTYVKPGKIILIQDPARLRFRMGGRIDSATSSTVTLDGQVTLQSGQTYTLWVQLPDGSLVSKTVTTAAGTVSALTISGTFATIPSAKAQWLLSSTAQPASRWRVISVREVQDQTIEITALANYQAKYALADITDSLVAAPVATSNLGAPSGLVLTHTTQTQSDRLAYSLSASWTAPTGTPNGYIAQYRKDTGAWIDMTVAGCGASAQDLLVGVYDVRVAAQYQDGVSDWVVGAGHTISNAGGSPAEIAQGGVDQINSVNYLVNLDKITLVQDWKAELQTQTQLDSQASTLGVSATAYDAAVAALSSGLISAGAPSNWATLWPDGTTWAKTGIMTSLQGWWQNIVSARTALMTAITAKVNTTATASGATATWGSISGGAAQAAPSGGWAGASNFTGAINGVSLSLTSPSPYVLWVNADATVTGTLFSVNSGGSFRFGVNNNGAVTANGGGSFGGIVSSPGFCAAGAVVTAGANACWFDAAGGGRIATVGPNSSTFNGWGIDQYTSDLSGYRRVFDITAAGVGYLNGSLILTLGNVGSNSATLQAAVASAMAPKVGTYAQMIAYSVPAGTTPFWYATDATAPDGLLGRLYQWNGSTWVDQGNPNAVIGRITAGIISAGAVGAQALAADIALIGQVIRSTGYTAGTSSVPPSGFKLSGSAFTVTYLDGTTDSVIADFGGNVSIAGMKAAVVANRIRGNTYTQSGTGTLDVPIPEGITSVELTLQAAGGNGGSSYGAGGNGGQYIRKTITVKPHNTYRITVGAVGSNSTFSWLSFDSTSGFTTDSGFATITATCGANGAGSSSGVNGTDSPNCVQQPEYGWVVTGGTGGDSGVYSGVAKAGNGGACGLQAGGAGPTATAVKTNSGGGGGASAMAPGGAGALTGANGTAGTLGSGGGGGATGGAGGPGFGRAKW
ncbi:TipJ family phage tail tip protein [Mesoterricola sediminis]|uniref:Tip attachment protein J domain-containing protein n=1 Tax=Mesoterricola sediminis TaxID=2927980 RepID=A0AA48KCQ9_9BACT|nr:phage tail protein [Mesoterricola sediminis]BDU76310.1 hypothetical protein METESE_12680 [Mesoterricola sediminis]